MTIDEGKQPTPKGVLIATAALLALSAVPFLWLVYKYAWAITETLKGKEISVASCLPLLVAAALFLIFRHTRALGYSIGTLFSLALVTTCLAFWHHWPDKTVSIFGWEVLTGHAALMSLTIGILWVGAQVWERGSHIGQLKRAVQARAEADSAAAKAQQLADSKTSTIEDLAKARTTLEKQVRDSEAMRSAEAQASSDRIKELSKNRLYEAQFVGGFLMMLGCRIARVGLGEPTSVNYLQGGRDAELADLVSATAGRFWMIEFKRSDAELKDEFTKRTRERQIEAIRKNRDIIIVADRCHFIGWGVQRTRRPTLSISRYLDLWRTQQQLALTPLMDAGAFLELALPDDSQPARIGATASEFHRYLQFLECHGGAETGDADFCALVMYQDSRGTFRFMSEPSFGRFLNGMMHAFEVAREREETRRREQERERDGPSQDTVPSRGR